jgi:ERCC4-related helicase
MARRARLLRVCSDPGHETLGDLDFNDPAKANVLDDLLDGILSVADEKVVIWTRYVDTARNMFKRYHAKWGASLLIGGEGSPEDLEKDEIRVLIATIARGSSSISLTPARNSIYESLDDISRNFAQSMARINRTGQNKDCKYWVLISEDTQEEDQYQAIMAKINLSEETLEEIGTPGRAQLIEQLKRSLTRPS